MNIVCLDMEGVLVPEIWIAFAEESGIPELKRTTRDEPDYDKLMKWRLEILKEHGPVSYTHLDVYKRQSQCRRGNGGGRGSGHEEVRPRIQHPDLDRSPGAGHPDHAGSLFPVHGVDEPCLLNTSPRIPSERR